MTMLISSHRFERMTPEMRPQDPTLDGSTLKFETMEHGGEYPDEMPQAIKVTDENGNWCIYHPTEVHGKVVRSHGYDFNPETGGKWMTPLSEPAKKAEPHRESVAADIARNYMESKGPGVYYGPSDVGG